MLFDDTMDVGMDEDLDAVGGDDDADEDDMGDDEDMDDDEDME